MQITDIVQATRLHLRDHWYGMNPLAPFDVEAELERVPRAGLQGQASFSLGYDERKRVETREATVSERVTRELLKSLAGVPAVRGDYVPYCGHTDDYPSISIELTTPEGPAVFFTESQDEYYVPWALRLEGVTYVVDSPEPGKVLKRLRRAVGAKRLDEMIEEAERSIYGR